MKKPKIDQYMLTACSLIMDELNELYGEFWALERSKDKLKEHAMKYSEEDFTMRIGHPFRQMVHYEVKDTKHHDLFVESKGFKIEVKYLKNWKSGKTRSNSQVWKAFQRDFDWLSDEIEAGNKGKCAFIIGWFNCFDYIGQVIQLGKEEDGKKTGGKPKASEEKLVYFPFLKKTSEPAYTKDLIYDYSLTYDTLSVKSIGDSGEKMNCVFLGSETDVFHFVIYY